MRTWQVWNDDQPQLHRRVLAGETIEAVAGLDTSSAVVRVSRWEAVRRYLPSLLRAALVTIVLSCLSMALAIALGMFDRQRPRLWPAAPCVRSLTGYVELTRGTPILLQLFVLYYGIAAADPPAGVRRGVPRSGPELRGLRERDLPVGASRRSDAASSKRRARSASPSGRFSG